MITLVAAFFNLLHLQRLDFGREEGLEAVEYALIAALIAVAIIAAVIGLQSQITATFNNITNALANPAN